MPDAVRELRDTPERRMFGANAFTAELPDGAVEGLNASEARQVALDVGAEPGDVAQFVSHQKQAAPTDAERSQWRAATTKMLKEREIGAADVALAQRFVQRDPRLAAALDRNGLGDRPDVVLRLVELARSARNSGTFK